MSPQRARFETTHVVIAMAALVAVLALLSSRYGYHRDELYFRMLPLAWGYVDQPPLMPMLVHGATWLLGDSLWALRVVAIALAAASLPLAALIAREVGGAALAQRSAAWGMAGATATLMFGHVLLTASVDLVVWPTVILFVLRAVLRRDGRWWLAAGAVAGASTYNKLLIAVLLAAIAAGLTVFGPRRWLRSGWLWAGVAITALLAAPNILYQATNGWPQLEMGAALAAQNAAEVRVMMWPFLVLLVGPVLAVFWSVALVTMFRRPAWRDLRFLAVAFTVVVAFVFWAGAQFYYTAGILSALTAIGAVPVAELARTRRRRATLSCLLAVNAAGCAVTSLPIAPLPSAVGAALAGINQSVADQVGWPQYVDQIERASVGADAIITSNYGEAGALDRFGEQLPPVFSGHNALWDLGGPSDADVVVIVGGQLDRVAGLFASCEVVDHLDNGVDVDAEEQGQPLAVCRNPQQSWPQLWPLFRHLS
ncbi:MAG: glycosyltransferase family 39 protein [Microbacterium sp.]